MAIIPNDEKVIMVSSTANTTYSGSKSLKEMAEWYTMEDVTSTVRPYKVYTALLTQSGSDGEFVNIIEEDLIIGATYFIKFSNGGDFTNVGAPDNNIDTYFVATGTTPNSWGSSILAYCSSAPVVTVLENTIGNVWFTYVSDGEYYINSNGLFTLNKTFANVSPNYLWESMDVPYTQYVSVGGVNDQILLRSYDNILLSNNIIGAVTQVFLEIRVYN